MLQTQSVVRQALCSALVIVGGEDCWEERHKLMVMLLETMTADLRRLASSGAHNPQEASPTLSRTFRLLAELVENSQAENTCGRKLLCSCLQVRYTLFEDEYDPVIIRLFASRLFDASSVEKNCLTIIFFLNCFRHGLNSHLSCSPLM